MFDTLSLLLHLIGQFLASPAGVFGGLLLMAAINTIPIWGKTPDIQWIDAVGITGNTTKDLTSGTNYLLYTADATNGSYVQKIRFRAKGTNVATVLRIWINNGSTTATLANNCYFDEITVAATTLTETAALAYFELAMNIALPAGYKIYVTAGTAVAAGYMGCTIAAKY